MAAVGDDEVEAIRHAAHARDHGHALPPSVPPPILEGMEGGKYEKSAGLFHVAWETPFSPEDPLPPQRVPSASRYRRSTSYLAHRGTDLVLDTGPSVLSPDRARTTTFDDDDQAVGMYSHWTERLAIPESNRIRQSWQLIVALLLLYTGTVFPWRLAFVDFRIKVSDDDISKVAVDTPTDKSWADAEQVMDILFYVDLVANFFFTFKDSREREVRNLWRIGRRYIRTYFFINLVACLPPSLMLQVMQLFTTNDASAPLNRTFRLARLQRTSRLSRLARLSRLLKVAPYVTSSPVWNWAQSMRGVRVVNFVVGLLWAVHLMACGWYICAALHDDPLQTWVQRRMVDNDGNRLIGEAPSVQWANSMYFVLVIFTTIGFGDIWAVTTGEVWYVSFTMIVGVIVNSLIVSETISALTTVDRYDAELAHQTELVMEFVGHAGLSQKTAETLMRCVRLGSQERGGHFDKKQMRHLLNTAAIPRVLAGELPEELFAGKLIRNKLVSIGHSGIEFLPTPPRLPLMLAVALRRRTYEHLELVYHSFDQPSHVYLVLEGTFAHVAKPDQGGGIDWLPPQLAPLAGTISGVRGGAVDGPTTVKSTPGLLSPHTPHGAHPTLSAGGRQGRYPYKIFGAFSYFGDYEVLMEKASARVTTTSCESEEGGVVLELPSNDLVQLGREFPRYAYVWRTTAARRESHRRRLLRNLTKPRNHKTLAAISIQRCWRICTAARLERSLHLCRGPPPPPVINPDVGVPAYAVQLRGQVEAVRHQVSDIGKAVEQLREEMLEALRQIAIERLPLDRLPRQGHHPHPQPHWRQPARIHPAPPPPEEPPFPDLTSSLGLMEV